MAGTKVSSAIARLVFVFCIGLLCLNTLQPLRSFVDEPAAPEAPAEESKPPELLLSVPFYVYEDLAWVNATFGGRPVGDIARVVGKRGVRFKHGDDYWFMEASLKHPMRTRNMDEAKLFFVPTLLNFFDYKEWMKNDKLCWQDMCDFELLNYTHHRLAESKAFQKFPNRHIIVRSFYSAHMGYWHDKLSQNDAFRLFLEDFRKMNAVVYEGKDRFPDPIHRITKTKYTVGTPCDLEQEKRYDVAMIASMKDKASFNDRRNICKWLKNAAGGDSAVAISKSVCGYGDRCPALAASKFGFHAAGDTWGSQRLMDTILSGTVPIFTHLNQYEIAGSWVDWSQLSYYLPVQNETRHGLNVTRHSLRPPTTEEIFIKRMKAILDDKEGYERRHRAVLEHIPFFDYTTMYPFDTYMYLFQAELYPETRHRKSRWSALLLPPPLFDFDVA